MKVGGDVRLSENKCLDCGYTLDACTVIDTDQTVMPKDGDITLCINCGYVMAFDDKANLREMTSEEMYRIAGDKRILLLTEAIAKVRKGCAKN